MEARSLNKIFKIIGMAVGVVTLNACGANDATPEPGEYQQSMKITKLELPGLDEDSSAEMIRQMEDAGNSIGTKFCMSAEQGANQWKEAASQMAGLLGGECDTIRDKGSANTLDLEMLCKATARGDVTVTMNGTARSDGYDSQMSFNMTDPKTAEKATLAMDIGANRLGDCAN